MTTLEIYIRIQVDGQVCICSAEEAQPMLEKLTAADRRHTWTTVRMATKAFESRPDFEGWQP